MADRGDIVEPFAAFRWRHGSDGTQSSRTRRPRARVCLFGAVRPVADPGALNGSRSSRDRAPARSRRSSFSLSLHCAPHTHKIIMSLATPTPDDLDELLLSCRYGDTEDIQQFIDRFGPDALATAHDDAGNTVLHMVAGNGHTGMSPCRTSPALPASASPHCTAHTLPISRTVLPPASRSAVD